MPGSFAEMLREMRVAAGVSQELLAERAGLSTDAIAALERGRRRHPRSSTVAALAAALGCSADDRATLTRLARRPTQESGTSRQPALVGRDGELRTLVAMLRSQPHGLVTLVGPGGVGKTTLIRAVIPAVASGYRDGTVQVDVSMLTEVPLVVAAIARGLGLGEPASRSPTELTRALATHDALLVLDSGERVPGLGAFIADLCRDAPRIGVVVTSRTPLRVLEERRFTVPPLPVPVGRTAAAIDANPAVRLFVDRAREVVPQFTLTDDNAAALATLCDRLGGLPLALQLAAARIRLLTIADLLDRLEQGLEVLAATTAMPERHRSLRATLDWTYGLLDHDTRKLFAAMGVFRGTFTSHAVEQVCQPGPAIFDQLDELLDAGC